MNEEHSNMKYSLADIEKYLQGKMSAAEMHELEKAALQDAFLADAIEGYNESSLQTAHKHLEEIQQKILNKKEETKVVAFTKKQIGWWRIAAAIIILFGIGTIAVWLNKKTDYKNSLVKNETTILPKKDADSVKQNIEIDTNHHLPLIAATQSFRKNIKKEKKLQPIIVDTIHSGKIDNTALALADVNSSLKKSEPIEVDKKTFIADNVHVKTDTIYYQPNANTNNALLGKVAGVQVTSTSSELKIRGMSSLSKNIVGKVVNEKGEPVSFATISNEKNKLAVATDANGNFVLPITDSVSNATISSIGYSSINTPLSANKYNKITLNQNNESLDEVVVTGFGVVRKKEVSSYLPSINKTDSLMPEGGWDNFKIFILKKLDNISDFHGNLEFELNLNNRGNVNEISILESPDKNLNTRIADAIKHGPKWIDQTKNKNIKKKVTLTF